MIKQILAEINSTRKQILAFEEEFDFKNFKKEYLNSRSRETTELQNDIIKKIKSDFLEEEDIIKIINLSKDNNELYFVYLIGNALKETDIEAQKRVVYYLYTLGNIDLLEKLIYDNKIKKEFAVKIVGGYESIVFLQGDDAREYVQCFEDGKVKKLFNGLIEYDFNENYEYYFKKEIELNGYDKIKRGNYVVFCRPNLDHIGLYKEIVGKKLR